MNPRYMHWQVAYRTSEDQPYKLIENPTWAWAADPFVIDFKGRILLFAELFLYRSERNGIIGFCEYDGDKFGSWKVSMDEHWHLSYPFVFEDDGELLMCPESYQRGDVSVYQIGENFRDWKIKNTLISNVQYVDTTLFSWKGCHYLYSFEPTFSGDEGSLLLYKLDSNGKYRRLAVVTDDITIARPGGRCFKKDGKLYRVGQNSSKTYGGSLAILEVETIEPVYREHIVYEMTPENIEINTNKKIYGVHTYNAIDGMEVIDIKYYEPSLGEYLASRHTKRVFTGKYPAEAL